ncbi:MAG TPA: 6-pyruvoyl-tetrahydropterin synthase-related protein [Patescibacteria group bacterium]|nr:6-pyruvoyl-tetrahydropterin synthase-related protein [Patescibacteria group bacterium]
MALFSKYKHFLLVILLGLFASWPLLHIGLIPTHDGEYHLIRFFEFDKMLRAGYLYPRWAPDLDFSYGLPLFTFVYPLPNYVASLLHLFGASFLDSVKLVMVVSTLFGGLFFYLWTEKFWGRLGALVSTTLYLFAPYRFVDIYVRGSVGEVMALGVFPGFLWTYTQYITSKKPVYVVASAIFLALTIFSHNILGLMFFVFTIFYMTLLIITSQQKKSLTVSSLFILLFSLGLSAIFWLPALFETQFVRGLQVYNIAQNFPDLSQLLLPSWGSGFFDSNGGDAMSTQIGLANIFVIIISCIVLAKLWRKKQEKKPFLIFSLLCLAVLVFFMLPISLFFWQTIPLIHYFQFPWRLLSLVILLCSFLAGSVMLLKPSKPLAIILIAIAILTTYSYTQPAYYMVRTDSYYTLRSNFIDGTNSPGNIFDTIWNTTKSARSKERFPVQNGLYVTDLHFLSPVNFSARTNTLANIQQSVALSFFPGWQVTVDGKVITVFPSKNGQLSFLLPKGNHTVHIFLVQTFLEEIAQYVSLLTALILILFLLRKRQK